MDNVIIDFISEVKDIFSYLLDSHIGEVRRSYMEVGVCLGFSSVSDFTSLEFEVDECLEKLSISRSFYYKPYKNSNVYMLLIFADGVKESDIQLKFVNKK